MVDLRHDLLAFADAVEEDRISVLAAEDFLRLLVRLELADGELERAIELADRIGSPSIVVVRDPVAQTDPGSLPSVEELDVDAVGDWALIMLASALAANGEHAKANTVFRMAADHVAESGFELGWDYVPVSRSLGPYYFTPWATAGLEQEALDYIATFSAASRAWAMVYIADGLAMRGDVEAIRRLIEDMPGEFPVLGKLSLAEAYRRTGDDDTALKLLDEAAHALEFVSPGLRDWKSQRRLAIGYALLGEQESAAYALHRLGNAPSFSDYHWRFVVPAIACHNVHEALGFITDKQGYRDLPATVEILISAAVSGQGEAAYRIAKDENHLVRRLTYLMAVLVGLRQAEDVPTSAIPCSTVSINAF